MFWKQRTEQKDDTFLAHVLREVRNGALSWTMYNFIHGYETIASGAWEPTESRNGELVCGREQCNKLRKTTRPELFQAGYTGAQLVDMECTDCKVERTRRNRLVPPRTQARLSVEFAAAPYIHPINEPSTLVS